MNKTMQNEQLTETLTVDHDVLLKRLQVSFGVCATPLKWMKSYVVGRPQTVIVNRSKSSMVKLSCDIPQGSMLGPLLFVLYTKDISVMVCGITAVPTIRRFISIAILEIWTHSKIFGLYWCISACVDVFRLVLMYFGLCWCISACVDVFRLVLMYFGLYWCISVLLMYFGLYWCISACIDVFRFYWCISASIDVFRLLLMHFGLYWCISACIDVFRLYWCISASIDVFRLVLMYFGFIDVFRLVLMYLGFIDVFQVVLMYFGFYWCSSACIDVFRLVLYLLKEHINTGYFFIASLIWSRTFSTSVEHVTFNFDCCEQFAVHCNRRY